MPIRTAITPASAETLPAPSSELKLIAIILRAQMRTLKPKARRRYLRAMAETLHEFEGDQNVIRIRHGEHDPAVAVARKKAAAWLRATLGAFFIADGER